MARAVHMSFYVTMNRVLAQVASVVCLCFSAICVVTGCGDASPPGSVDPGGVHSSTSNNGGGGGGGAGDAAPDQGNGYRDPVAPDGGCLQPNLVCSGVCTAIDSDPNNCGACGSACIPGDSVCVAGKCGCSGQLEDYCDGVGCMDVSSDFNNCGSCGNACDPNNDQACTGGVCIPNDP